ncbi:restriction endonuclease [Collinsella intestinalis]|nr:restriction endonuclease [Collinsella intestinalis]
MYMATSNLLKSGIDSRFEKIIASALHLAKRCRRFPQFIRRYALGGSFLGADIIEMEKRLRTLEKDPTFFEQLVVDLLIKMGYGQGRKTQVSNDGGIDGIIAIGALGFDPIYVQAKRYTPGNTVGRPELQGFAGALGSISRGVFITTSSFAKSAVEWASHYPHATLVLIDGRRLTELIVQYDLGVSTERVYRIKRLDGDYFGDE